MSLSYKNKSLSFKNNVDISYTAVYYHISVLFEK